MARADDAPEASVDSGKNPNAPGQGQPAAKQESGLFGGLTLDRAHATGHAVWLHLPADGIKLKCNELIHARPRSNKPGSTYFRGDLTRPLEIEKIDLVHEAGSPGPGKVKSVTHIWTVDATTYDKGNGFDTADIVATGPGRLETQPGQGQPVERIALWQEKLYVQNELDSSGRIKQKAILLTGKQPTLVDNTRAFSINSAQWIRIFMVPQAPPTAEASAKAGDDNADGGGLDIKRLLAFRDVHLLGTGKSMTARSSLTLSSNSAPQLLPHLLVLPAQRCRRIQRRHAHRRPEPGCR